MQSYGCLVAHLTQQICLSFSLTIIILLLLFIIITYYYYLLVILFIIFINLNVYYNHYFPLKLFFCLLLFCF